jgi:PAS domain-containing protein
MEDIMDQINWWSEFPVAMTLCDRDGIILEMNARALEAYKEDGGAGLIGQNALDCHPEPARQMLAEMLASGQQHIYMINKGSLRELIYQAPWYRDGQYAGFVELQLEIPQEIANFIRDA